MAVELPGIVPCILVECLHPKFEVNLKIKECILLFWSVLARMVVSKNKIHVLPSR